MTGSSGFALDSGNETGPWGFALSIFVCLEMSLIKC